MEDQHYTLVNQSSCSREQNPYIQNLNIHDDQKMSIIFKVLLCKSHLSNDHCVPVLICLQNITLVFDHYYDVIST